MGYGGYVTLINATPYSWNQTYSHSYEMNTWNFPSSIPPGYSEHVYVELQEEFYLPSDDAGDVIYTIEFPSAAANQDGFRLSFHNNGGRNGYIVNLLGISVDTSYAQQPLNFSFEHNNDAQWVLSGDGSGNGFVSPYLKWNWMTANMQYIGCLPLSSLSLPGSHDSGMYALDPNGGGAGGDAANTLAQSLDIYSQLVAGTRWFDIRPVKSGGQFVTGHYTSSVVGMVGGNGGSIADIIDDINNFTAIANTNELIILELSHAYDSDAVGNPYPDLSSTEWYSLLQQMTAINHLYTAPVGTQDLADLTLNEIVGDSPAVVIIVRDDTVGISSSLSLYPGVYPGSFYSLYNDYSNTADFDTMQSDQLGKLHNHPSSDKSFLLAWILTQGVFGNIRDSAVTANQHLYDYLWGNLSTPVIPNIIQTDNVQSDGAIAALSMAINYFVGAKQQKCPSQSKSSNPSSPNSNPPAQNPVPLLPPPPTLPPLNGNTSSSSPTTSSSLPYANPNDTEKYLPCKPGSFLCTSATEFLTCDQNPLDPVYRWHYPVAELRQVATGMKCEPMLVSGQRDDQYVWAGTV